ncbi:LCP family protein [Ornithinibacillus massiliensis]|uniref:LCP family protein n=1 Tax=Ornithinibacillus massiliensis TaxID=1944633 RepID=A0ABS5MDH4_9BACI|nr:LCP family protein [Ornithinibacillus massiliensis]MBS3679803.1 LCP family protein [Ornithinibacillus massiliensis]
MDKRIKDNINNLFDQELRFTKEDRNKVFEQINIMEKNTTQKKSLVSIVKQFSILTASLLVVSFCIFLFIPSILYENSNNENNGSNLSGVITHEDEYVTTLFTVKDENNRIPINLLLTYSKDKKMMKFISIPRDTYVPILGNDETTSYDKLTHAYAYGAEGTESVKTTVTNLFDVKIDYYAVLDLDTLSALIDSVNGIDYELEEDIRVRAISQVAFEFKKGTHRLNGEEVVALMMDATVGKSMDDKDQLNLIHAVINQTINVISQTQLKEFSTKIEGNIPIEQLFEAKMELPSIHLVSLIDGMVSTMIDEAYYIKFETDFLNSVSEELTTFN